MIETGDVQFKLESLIQDKFSEHPFDAVREPSCKHLLANFFAMSQAFPYLQAGSQRDLILRCIDENSDVPNDVEITSVIGNFLSWDETGGFYLMRRFGIEKLPEILNSRHFHANMLRQDLFNLYGEPLAPAYDPATVTYLRELLEGLSAVDPVQRCASMVSFEMHAGRMIEALWASLQTLFADKASRLKYFNAHVGGADPAEAYHIEMTQKMIAALVPTHRHDEFIALFEKAYGQHVAWCLAINTHDAPQSMAA